MRWQWLLGLLWGLALHALWCLHNLRLQFNLRLQNGGLWLQCLNLALQWRWLQRLTKSLLGPWLQRLNLILRH